MHGSRKRIVGALRFIHMIVGMQQFFPCDFIATARDHLVDIHVGLGAASRLIYYQRKVFVQLSADELVTHTCNQFSPLCVNHTQTPVGQSRCLFSTPKAWMISRGIFVEPILKFSKLLSVWAPQYLSAGTFTSPMVSCSMR